jgi:type IV secretory pathway VirB10-like protein
MTPDGNVSEIRDRMPKPAKDRRTMFMIGGAVVVVLAMTISQFTGSSKPAVVSHATAETAQEKPPAQQSINQFRDQLSQQTNALAVEKTRAEAMQVQAAQVATGVPPTVQQQYGSPVSVPVAAKEGSTGFLSFRPTQPTELHQLIDAEKQALAANLEAASKPASAQGVPNLHPLSETTAGTWNQLIDERAKELAASPLNGDVTGTGAAHGKTYKLFEGTLIESVLTNRLNGSFTGPVSVLVTSPVYSHDNQHVLIPAGSRIIGEAAKVGTQGQQRLAVTFHRLIEPDGYSCSLDKFTGLNQQGETGLKDKINHHYVDLFGTSIALGLVSGLSGFGTGSALTTGGFGQYRQSVGSSIGQSSTQVLESRLTNNFPTITITEGHRVRVWIQQDIDLPAYEDHKIAGNL